MTQPQWSVMNLESAAKTLVIFYGVKDSSEIRRNDGARTFFSN